MDSLKSVRSFPLSSTLLAFIGMVILAGFNPVAVRFSDLELPPFWGAALRFLVAALVYWGIILVRRIPLPRGRALLGAILYGMVSIGLFFALMYYVLQKVHPGLTSVFLAMAPLMTLFFALLHRQEKFRWAGLIGAAIALAGLLLGLGGYLSGAGASSEITLGLVLMLLLAVASQSYGSVMYKFIPRSDPFMVNALAMTAGALLLVLVSLLGGETWALPQTPATWASFAYLTLLGSVVVFYLQLFVLNRWTATATSYSFLLFPIVTVIVSAWLTGEVVTLQFVVGAAIVLLGVWVGALAPAKHVPLVESAPGLQITETGCVD
jgi:drug/metabolite transporter (DMT)-like permease